MIELLILGSPFFDVSIEKRCDALAAFVRSFAEREMPALGVKPLACSEGNGLGGARYSVEFRTDDKKAKTETVDVALGERPGDAKVSFEGENAKAMAPAVAAWVKQKATRTTIFDEDYFLFATNLASRPMTLWVGNEPDKHEVVSLKLDPDPNTPMSGRVKIDAASAPAAFLKCFACADHKCFDDAVRYRLSHRLFTLTRESKEKGQDQEALGASWIMIGPAPVPKVGPTWRYACGASRYSLTVTTPAGSP